MVALLVKSSTRSAAGRWTMFDSSPVILHASEEMPLNKSASGESISLLTKQRSLPYFTTQQRFLPTNSAIADSERVTEFCKDTVW